jgi:hypothetical protein
VDGGGEKRGRFAQRAAQTKNEIGADRWLAEKVNAIFSFFGSLVGMVK